MQLETSAVGEIEFLENESGQCVQQMFQYEYSYDDVNIGI